MVKRCNEIKDCKDESDEKNCTLVKIREGIYREEYPSVLENKSTAQVYVNVSIVYIDKLEESEMSFSIKILVQLKWYDSRVTFDNLKIKLKQGNKVGNNDRNQLWIPKLIFSNSLPEVQVTNDELSLLMVKQESDSKMYDENELQENEFYEGHSNPFIYQRYYDLNLRCNYEFSKYPFDQQNCSIIVSQILKNAVKRLR